MNINGIIKDILAERNRQDVKYGEVNATNTEIEFCAILGEEIGEANQAIVDAHFKYKPEVQSLQQARVELVQVAATALQMHDVHHRQRGEYSTFTIHGIDIEKIKFGVEAFNKEHGGTMRLVAAMASIGYVYGRACYESIGTGLLNPDDYIDACIGLIGVSITAIWLVDAHLMSKSDAHMIQPKYPRES